MTTPDITSSHAFFRYALLGLLVLSFGVSFAQEGAVRTVTVDGVGTVYGAPQIAQIDLGVMVTNDNPAAATSEANEIAANVIDTLVNDLGIERADLQTVGFDLFREERFDGPNAGRSTYRVSNTLRVTVRDLEQVGAVLSESIEAGANMVNALNYTFADAAALEDEARALAMEDATAKATQLAALAGSSLGPVQAIVASSGGSSPVPSARFDTAVMSAAPVESGQLAVSVSVQVRFALQD